MTDPTTSEQQPKLGPWRNIYEISLPESALRRKQFSCPDPQLFPTHPQQTLKQYHRYDAANYSAADLDARDDECVVSRLTRASEVARTRIIEEEDRNGRRIPCIVATQSHYVTISDTYIDRCGNYYRGVYSINFLKIDESMGTLFSKGRTTYDDDEENRRTGYSGNTYSGNTYAVPVSEFDYLAELLPGDMEGINRGRAIAIGNTHDLAQDKLIFISRRN